MEIIAEKDYGTTAQQWARVPGRGPVYQRMRERSYGEWQPWQGWQLQWMEIPHDAEYRGYPKEGAFGCTSS